MFRQDKWPFTPVCLSEIIGRDRMAVIESGCCERLGRALTILDYDPDFDEFVDRIESINEKQRYEKFCGLLRDEKRVQGGDNACKVWDMGRAKISLQEFRRSGNMFRSFRCHMGLHDMTYLIQVGQRPVAILFSGQYRPVEGIDLIEEKVRALGTDHHSRVKLDESTRQELLSLAEELPPAPEDIRDRLKCEAEHIQSIAEAEYARGKHEWEQDFLESLRVPVGFDEADSLGKLRQSLRGLLEMVQIFCRCQYVVFFGSMREGDTVLAPVADVGLPPSVAKNTPHFNWKKANLPLRGFDARTWDIADWSCRSGPRGIRGDNSEYFTGEKCIVPTSLGNRYRGALVLGPLAEDVDLQKERRFLAEMADTIGSPALTGLEMVYLERERRRWQSTALLLAHQLRTGLTPITTQIGRAKRMLERSEGGIDVRRISGLLGRTEELSMQLAQGARETLAAYVLQVEAEDLDFERYPLSVLVMNCATGFMEEAERKGRTLEIDSGVESLPQADVDVARLTIALGNMIDNAIKYSYADTKIFIRSRLDLTARTELAAAVIEVDDLGLEIPEEERQRIFEQGTRGLTAAKMGYSSGSGLGLWEARAVVVAHGGEIDVRCDRTSIRRREGQAHHVVFSMRIPLRQKVDKRS
jgi:signal transduction histidine kinase/ligand-binding sensor protein